MLTDCFVQNMLYGRSNPSVGDPVKKYQSKIRQLTGEKRGNLDVDRRRMEPERSDKGNPLVLSTEAMKNQSKTINAGRGSSKSCTVKQNLRKWATDEKEKLFCICRTRYDPSR